MTRETNGNVKVKLSEASLTFSSKFPVVELFLEISCAAEWTRNETPSGIKHAPLRYRYGGGEEVGPLEEVS